MSARGGGIVHLANFNQFDDARQAASVFVKEAEEWRRQYGAVAFLQLELLHSLSSAAVVLARMGRPDAADQPSSLALEIGRQLTALEPGNMDWLHAYASAVLFDLDVRTRLNALNDAQADADRAQPLYQKVLEHFPDDVGIRLEAMQLRDEWADLDAHMDRKDLAVA